MQLIELCSCLNNCIPLPAVHIGEIRPSVRNRREAVPLRAWCFWGTTRVEDLLLGESLLISLSSVCLCGCHWHKTFMTLFNVVCEWNWIFHSLLTYISMSKFHLKYTFQSQGYILTPSILDSFIDSKRSPYQSLTLSYQQPIYFLSPFKNISIFVFLHIEGFFLFVCFLRKRTRWCKFCRRQLHVAMSKETKQAFGSRTTKKPASIMEYLLYTVV